jgi:hypothetical protein
MDVNNHSTGRNHPKPRMNLLPRNPDDAEKPKRIEKADNENLILHGHTFSYK